MLPVRYFIPARFAAVLVAWEPYLKKLWHYVISRLIDHHSPLWLSDGLILFLLSLAFPPLLTWLAVILWLKRRERNRFRISRRVIAEGLARHLGDLAISAAKLIAATISARPTEEPEKDLSTKLSTLEDFVAMRTPLFPPEEMEQIGEVIQASEYVAHIAQSAAGLVRGDSVAIILQEPVLTAVTQAPNGKNLGRTLDEPGVVADTLDQYLDVLDAVSNAWIKLAREFVTLHTKRLWDLQLAETALQKVSDDLRRQKTMAPHQKKD